jgi:hypothetical protein
MNRPPSDSAGRRAAPGCGCLLPPLLALGIVAWLLRDGIPPAIDGYAPPQLVFGAIVVMASLALGLIIFVLGRRKSRFLATSRDPASQPITGPGAPLGKRLNVGRLVFGIFFIFGLAFTIPFAIMLWSVVESRGWEEVRCTVLSSQVRTHSSSDGSTYSVDITYRYRWQGDTLRGNRYNFTFGSSSGYDGKAEVVARYPVGSEVPCWVDPRRPERSVLSRTVGWEALIILFPLVFVTIGLFGLLGTFGTFGRASLRKDDWLPGTTDEERFRPPVASAVRSTEVPADRNVLETKTTPRGRLIGSIVGATIWNGLVWTGIYFVIIRDGDAEGCIIAFLGLFALVGLLILSSVPYYALALANPVLKARFGGVLTPRRSTSFSWRFEGRADRIRKLIIRLQGREEARYRRGTDTRTDKHVFYDEVIFETTTPPTIASGQTTVRLPEGTMHSFDGGNNKVIWTLSVRGDIPRWPDVNEEFVITVRPEGM